jgi:hypothetical protein
MVISEMKIFLPAAACFVMLAAAVGAQTAPPSTGMIGGVVLDGVTQKPVRRAIVTLTTTEARPQEAVAWTDAEGRFAFGYLPPGQYRLFVNKAGYQYTAWGAEGARSRGKVIPLRAGENRTDLSISLAVSAAVSGFVTDEDGDPIGGAQVNLYMPTIRRGRHTVQPMNSATTDSRGRYRIANVFPGKFMVGVDIASEAARGNSEVSVGQPQEKFMYEAQFYPGTTEFQNATTLTVVPGKELEGINFRLRALPMATLRGRVVVPADMDVATGIQVMAAQDTGSGRRGFRGSHAGPPDFAFQIPGLRPGTYRVIATASSRGNEFRGVQRVQIGRENEVTLTLEPAVELAGSVKIEGPDAAKYSVSTVSLTPGDDMPMSRPVRAQIAKDGTFKLPGVLPGVWDINVTPIPPGGYLKSMHLGDQDVLLEEMTIRPSTAVPLKIVVSTAGAVVNGHVEGEPGTRYFVVLWPTGKFADVESFRVNGTTDDKGEYVLKGVTPGTYNLWAFTQSPGPNAADLLKSLEAEATKVEVTEGQTITHNLKPITPGGQN